MITKKMAGRIALSSMIVSLFGMGIVSASNAGCVSPSGVYLQNGQSVFCPISSSSFFNGVSAGVQQNAVSALGGLSNLSTLFVTALFVLLILAIVYFIAIKLILPFLT